MSIFNEINAARIPHFLTKLFGMKGPVPVRQLSGEVMAVLNLFSGAENRLLETWQRYGAFTVVAAGGAGNISGVRLRNNFQTKVVAVVERVEISTTAIDQPRIRIGQAPGDLAVVASLVNANLDDRATITTPSLAFSSQNNAVSVPALTNQFSIAGPNIAANTPYQFMQNENQEIPLPPGAGFQIESTVANQAISVSVLWRERPLEDSELANL